MQYNKKQDGTLEPLAHKNVDTGMGLERTICVLTGKKSVYDTDLFANILGKIAELSGKTYGQSEEVTKAFRIVGDHMRTATFILGDDHGVSPSNVGQGYVLRRLIRRAVRYGMELGMAEGFTGEIAKVIVEQYKAVYPELTRNVAFVLDQLAMEETRFDKTLKQGNHEFEKIVQRLEGTQIDGESAFHLYDTYGFPVEMTIELARERGLTIDQAGYDACFRKHQENSHAGADAIFKGGLADHSDQTARLHTATHLLHAALRKVLGPEVAQKGSNITAERLRFDFSFGRKMTPEEVAEVERLVNESIAAAAPITCVETTVAEAKAEGAIGLFESKYGEKVRMYTMGPFSKEICGGPHAENTGDLISFKIQKEESSSAGVRRIKATIGAKAEA
jgi:alanyl-tRNA synthetase